jgi:CRISPR system Cascade subunit CasA
MRKTRPQSSRLAPVAGALIGAALAAACAHYAPAPIDPAAFPRAYDQRTLDLATPAGAGPGDHLALLAQALRFSPAVRQGAGTYASAEAAARSARQAPVSTLTLLSEYEKEADKSSPWLLGFQGDIPLDLGGRGAVRRSTADRTVISALYDYGETIWTVRSALTHAEIERAAAIGETALVDRLVQLRRLQVELTEARVRGGENPRIDAARARTDLAAAERRLDADAARRAKADAAIAAAIGVPVPALTSLAAAPLPAAPPPMPSPADLQAWRNTAVLARADVLRGVVAYAQSEDDLRLEVAKQYPDVHIQPGYILEQGINKLPFNLALTLPPTDLNRANIARAEAARSEAGRKLEALQAGVLAGADGAADALRLAIAAADQAERREVAAATRVRTLTEHGVRGGENDRLELIVDQAAELEAEIAALDARRAAWDAQASLEDALRRPFDANETTLITQAAQQPIRRSS